MRPLRFITALLMGVACGQIPNPGYTAAGIVNAASNVPGSLSPGMIVSVYGTNLAFETRAVTGSDVRGGVLPVRLAGSQVSVQVSGIAAPLLYVSPGQINFLIPSEFLPGSVEVVVSNGNRAGPAARVTLLESNPAFFLAAPGWAVAQRPNGTLITAQDPALPDEWVTLWVNGLGPVSPALSSGQIPQGARPLTDMTGLLVVVDGEILPPDRVGYAGAAPGFAGVYQLNIRLHYALRSNPTVQLLTRYGRSPAEVRIPVRGS